MHKLVRIHEPNWNYLDFGIVVYEKQNEDGARNYADNITCNNFRQMQSISALKSVAADSTVKGGGMKFPMMRLIGSGGFRLCQHSCGGCMLRKSDGRNFAPPSISINHLFALQLPLSFAVIFSFRVLRNQASLALHPDPNAKGPKNAGKAKVAKFKQKCAAVLAQLNIPTTIYAATARDHYRKPRAGIWREVCAKVTDVGGKAAATAKDFSCSDRNMTRLSYCHSGRIAHASGGKPVGLLKGRRASIFGKDDRVTSTESQHDHGLEKDKKPVEIYQANSEPDEDVRGVEVVGEVMQDVDGANEAQWPLEFNNIVGNGISERVDDDEFQPEDELAGESDDPTAANDDGVAAPCNSEVDDEFQPEDELAGESDDPTAANDDGVAAPCNSKVDDEEFGFELCEDGEDAEASDEPRVNTEQEAEEISRMYDEVQYAEMDDDGEDHASDDDEYSLEAIRARRLAREISATAASISGCRGRQREGHAGCQRRKQSS
ncbi:hypothetical protein F4860DRAFT_522998 [Xylaria cubensis]|nr:hypothetical protein F4860DRAFT_522998 [Xylaria cubensis]